MIPERTGSEQYFRVLRERGEGGCGWTQWRWQKHFAEDAQFKALRDVSELPTRLIELPLNAFHVACGGNRCRRTVCLLPRELQNMLLATLKTHRTGDLSRGALDFLFLLFVLVASSDTLVSSSFLLLVVMPVLLVESTRY